MSRKNGLLAAAWLLVAVIIAAAPAASSASPLKIPGSGETRRVALVIDDFGNDMKGTEQMMELPIPFAAAVMPFLPTTKRDAEWAHRKGQTVLVHVPMEPFNGRPEWLGPGAITTKLSDEEVRQRITAAIEDVPYAVGINNHMGSKATADERVMRIVLTVCKEKGMFMLDSRTNYKSVVGKLAAELGVPTANNHMFMDDVHTRSHIAKQAVQLQKLAHTREETIVIGHVGASGNHTAEVLKGIIPVIQQSGAAFVPISEMMR
ncbi:divergent polysaccharide deacetylase family protein [Paenibacillus puerhi]|uniref:divergent polysaccharide deacetylase family protein n=1 Tax=Paenibacillus puerhi TaxID=2692622 RepID=UPI00135AA8FF|nr:divergent polysaccharide deacetylase family protein [Paenibacillus puerhi]